MMSSNADYVLVEWVEDSGLSVEKLKQVHTLTEAIPTVGKVYAVDYREGPGRVVKYQGKILKIGDKISVMEEMSTITGEILEMTDPPTNRRVRKAPLHLDNFFVVGPSQQQKKRQGKSKRSPSAAILKAKEILQSDVVEELDVNEDDDNFTEVQQLRMKVRRLEEENKNLKGQLDIQDTVKNLKKVVRRLSENRQQDCDTFTIDDNVRSIEDDLSFEHLRYKPSDNNVIELVKGSRIYITRAEQMAANTAKSDTTMARNLMCRIFNNTSLLMCSVKGNRSKGKGKTDRKAALNPRGVNAIIDYVLRKYQKSGDRAPALVAAMGTRLSELRSDSNSFAVPTSDEETQLDTMAVLADLPASLEFSSCLET